MPSIFCHLSDVETNSSNVYVTEHDTSPPLTFESPSFPPSPTRPPSTYSLSASCLQGTSFFFLSLRFGTPTAKRLQEPASCLQKLYGRPFLSLDNYMPYNLAAPIESNPLRTHRWFISFFIFPSFHHSVLPYSGFFFFGTENPGRSQVSPCQHACTPTCLAPSIFDIFFSSRREKSDSFARALGRDMDARQMRCLSCVESAIRSIALR
ncbi:hypothetical protein B0F90DRAFT_290206 [Multifurca ochricompacta]|uniref:Uncharacterized protein n=1 Tax=Multifurca ochricompacta TaxID=376703 RepID=A0AAD4M4E9_9AGAM|nr:hypothetical protein B0F90DRAFT_290206 [Multifurca ochricompacta]